MALEGECLDRYHLPHLLGCGGIGVIYLSAYARIGKQVAIIDKLTDTL